MGRSVARNAPVVVTSLAPFWSSPSRSIVRIPHFHEETSLPPTSVQPHHERLAEGKTKNQGGAGWAVKLSPHGELGLARGYPELLVSDHWSTRPVKRRVPGVIDVPRARPPLKLTVDRTLRADAGFRIREGSCAGQWSSEQRRASSRSRNERTALVQAADIQVSRYRYCGFQQC